MEKYADILLLLQQDKLCKVWDVLWKYYVHLQALYPGMKPLLERKGLSVQASRTLAL